MNLTSRIEGLSKFYGTEILLSAACVEAAGDALLTRPVDMVSVKGRSNGIVVHELLGVADDPPPHVAERISLTEAAFRLYLASDFAAARECYLTAEGKRIHSEALALRLQTALARLP